MSIYLSVLREVQTGKKPYHFFRALAAKYFLALSHKTVIGITGSVGKTTTTKAIKVALGSQAISTIEDLDSIFNIPITVLRSAKYKFLVLEMGVQYLGDMDFNISVSPVNVAVFTRISSAHTEFLSDKEGIFSEKSKIITPKTKLIIFNNDDELLRKKFSKSKIPTLSFGMDQGSDFQIKIIKETVKNTLLTITHESKVYKLRSSLIGKHQSYSIAAAFAVGTYFKIKPELLIDNLTHLTPASNRFNLVKSGNAYIVKDIYNSSPQALSDAIDFVNSQKYNHKIAYLGDMLELGNLSQKEHLTIAKQLAKSDFDEIYTYGSEMEKVSEYLLLQNLKTKIEHLTKPVKIEKISYPPSTLILVKGSHGMHMEHFFSVKKV